MKIISPSYKRAGNVRTLEIFGGDLVLAVHEFEADAYKAAHPDNPLLVLPDSLKGNMAKVRNYILDNCNDKHLLMVDDDISTLGYHENISQVAMNPDQVTNLLVNGFEMAEALGTKLWGINLQSDPKFYREYSPFSFLSPVLGPFCGHIVEPNGVKYDERLGLNEDYDFFIQSANRYRRVLRLNKFYYMAGHLKDKGGCGAYRLLDDEKDQAQTMLRKWGKRIVRYDFKRSTNPVITLPIKGI